jgi:hypothetical protein
VQTKNGEKTHAKKEMRAHQKNEALKPVRASSVSDEVQAHAVKDKPVHNYQSHAKKVVSGNFANIMQTLAEKSAKGSLSHTKYLFEIGGVKEDIQRQGQGKGEPSLADLLLAEMRKQKPSEDSAAKAVVKASGELDAETESVTEERGGDCGAKAQ